MDSTHPTQEELKITLAVLAIARTDLMMTAQGNILREHHLRDYILTLEEVAKLWDAQRILEELYKEEDESSEPLGDSLIHPQQRGRVT